MQAQLLEAVDARKHRKTGKDSSRRDSKFSTKSKRDEKEIEITRLKSKIKTDAREAAQKIEDKQNIIKQLQAKIKILEVENDYLKMQIPTKT